MPTDADGVWHPDLSPKQREVMAACMPGPLNVLLLSGPRWSGKTWCLEDAICQNAWATDRGNTCILTVTQSAGSDSGPWEFLTESFLPKWIGDKETGEGGNFGMRWIREPFIASVTKKPTCIVSNAFGNQTKISLESLKNEDEVEARFKGKQYSTIWLNELSNFKNRKTLITLLQCLRLPHLTPQQHLFVADTNPAPEGQSSWIYWFWYEFRRMSDDAVMTSFNEAYPELAGTIPMSKLIALRDRFRLIEFTLDDNAALSQEKKDQVFSDFVGDPDLLDRYYYGKWVTAAQDAIFYATFRPKIHVIGEIETPLNPDPETLTPHENCWELITGWDPGDSINSAAVIAEKYYTVADVIKLDDGEEKIVRVPHIAYLDELVIVGDPHRTEDFVYEFMLKMAMWEKFLGHPVSWRHWSDRSVWERVDWRGNASRDVQYLADLIFATSAMLIKKGEIALKAPISLEAAGRGPGSVGPRIDLWKRMLFENRIHLSAAHCPRLIESNKSLRKPKSGSRLIQPGSPYKHAWDAASYLLAEECYDEMANEVLQEIRTTRRKAQKSSLVSISL